MTRPRLSVRTTAGAICLSALTAALGLPVSSPAAAATACGRTTLDGTVVVTSTGRLRCGPGEQIVVRQDLTKGSPTRVATRQGLLSFLALGDMHAIDEESPLRQEFADACDTEATHGLFRPQESMLLQLADAHVRAASTIAATGSPVLRRPVDFAVQLGDSIDNKQANETRWAIDLLDGGKIINPDSGGDGYDGTQTEDPRGAETFPSPVKGKTILDLANEPFYANGLRTAAGTPLPWYAVAGSHDVKVAGTAPDTTGDRELASAIATGPLKTTSGSPEARDAICDDPSRIGDPATIQSAITSPSSAPKVVPADPQRHVITREAWIAAHAESRGLPVGHGLAGGRCTDANNVALERACYSWDQGPFHMIALDTAPSEAGDTGNLDPAQAAWLKRDLVAASSRYFDDAGKERKTAATDRIIIVFSYHSTATLTNRPPGQGVTGGAALEDLLLHFPNVVLHVNASTHRDAVTPHRDEARKTGYWEVTTGSMSDLPNASRSIEIADNTDGTLSIFGIRFEGQAPLNARTVSWASDDLTPEKKLGGTTTVNEAWLAAAAREVAANDPQADRTPIPAKARNVELLTRNPLGVTRNRVVTPPPFRPFVPFTPNFPTGFPFPSTFPRGFPGGLPPGGAFPFPPATGLPPTGFQGVTTGKGLPITPVGSNALTPRIALLMLAAGSGAVWLTRARVRRWMIGI